MFPCFLISSLFSSFAQGSFKLPNLKASTLTLTAKKPHYYFSDVTRLPVSPSMRSLPPITATSYDICAQVSLDKDSKFDRKRKVILSGAQKPQTGVTDKDGSVCFQVWTALYCSDLLFIGFFSSDLRVLRRSRGSTSWQCTVQYCSVVPVLC